MLRTYKGEIAHEVSAHRFHLSDSFHGFQQSFHSSAFSVLYSQFEQGHASIQVSAKNISLRRDCSLLECVPGWVPKHEGIDSPEGNVKTSNCTFTSNFVTQGLSDLQTSAETCLAGMSFKRWSCNIYLFFIKRSTVDLLFYLLSALSVGQMKTLGSAVGNYLIH